MIEKFCVNCGDKSAIWGNHCSRSCALTGVVKRPPRVLTEDEKRYVTQRYATGESLKAIAETLEVDAGNVRKILVATGIVIRSHAEQLNQPNVHLKMSDAWDYDKHFTDITREKISIAGKGRKYSKEQCEQRSQSLKASVAFHEAQARIAANRRGKPGSPAVRAALELGRAVYAQSSPEKIQADKQKRAEGGRTPQARQRKREASINHWNSLSDEEKRASIEHCYPKERPFSTEITVEQELIRLGVRYIPNYKGIGWYELDFYLPDFNAIIECDGNHYHNSNAAKKHDRQKDFYLWRKGHQVFRYAEYAITKDVRQLVTDTIDRLMENRSIYEEIA